MAAIPGFDANKVTPSTGFGHLPAGTYTCAIADSEVKAASTGNGDMIKLKIQVIDGPHKNQILWENLCLWHKTASTAQMAAGRLSAICHAVGVLNPNDTAELHNRPMSVTVKVKTKNTYDGSPQNEITKYEKLGAKKEDKDTADNGAISETINPEADRATQNAAFNEMKEGTPW